MVSAAQPRIEPVSHLVFGFVPQANEEQQSIGRVLVDRGRGFIRTTLEFPVLEGTMLGPLKTVPLMVLVEASVLNALGTVVRMEQVAPRDHH